MSVKNPVTIIKPATLIKARYILTFYKPLGNKEYDDRLIMAATRVTIKCDALCEGDVLLVKLMYTRLRLQKLREKIFNEYFSLRHRN